MKINPTKEEQFDPSSLDDMWNRIEKFSCHDQFTQYVLRLGLTNGLSNIKDLAVLLAYNALCAKETLEIELQNYAEVVAKKGALCSARPKKKRAKPRKKIEFKRVKK